MNFPRIRAAMLSSRCLKRAGAAWFLSCCTALAFSGSFASPEAVTVPLWLWGAGTAAWFLALSFPCVLVPARPARTTISCWEHRCFTPCC